MSEHTITILTVEKFNPLRTVYSTGLVFILIGAGVYASSTAMQWAGFILLGIMFLGLFVRSMSEAKSRQNVSIDEARRILDRLEADSAVGTAYKGG